MSRAPQAGAMVAGLRAREACGEAAPQRERSAAASTRVSPALRGHSRGSRGRLVVRPHAREIHQCPLQFRGHYFEAAARVLLDHPRVHAPS